MEYQKIDNGSDKLPIINKVESGMPRWLIEAGFVLMIAQAVCNEQHLCDWIEGNGLEIPRSIIYVLGDIILFYAMMRGMKPLRHPYTWMWWLLIVLNIAGDLTYMVPYSTINLVLAVAQPLAYLPLGVSIGFFYRGRLQWVGILMVAFMVTIIIFPIMFYKFIPFELIDAVAIFTQIAMAWTMRKMLI